MKKQNAYAIISFLSGAMAVVMFLMFAAELANATNNSHHNDDVDINQDQAQQQSQNATADAVSDSVSESISSSSNEGNTLEGGDVNVGGDSVENNSSNVVLVPNNNTESCVRVWGIAFGRDADSAALGIPWRSKACDYEQAADDAFAAGARELGWFWKCQNQSLAKGFKQDGMSMDEARNECHRKAVGDINAHETIDQLKRTIDFLQQERVIDRENCEESKQRITEAWRESTSPCGK